MGLLLLNFEGTKITHQLMLIKSNASVSDLLVVFIFIGDLHIMKEALLCIMQVLTFLEVADSSCKAIKGVRCRRFIWNTTHKLFLSPDSYHWNRCPEKSNLSL